MLWFEGIKIGVIKVILKRDCLTILIIIKKLAEERTVELFWTLGNNRQINSRQFVKVGIGITNRWFQTSGGSIRSIDQGTRRTVGGEK